MHITLLYSTMFSPYITTLTFVLYNTVLYCIIYYLAQQSTIKYAQRTTRYSTIQYSTVQYTTALYITVQYSKSDTLRWARPSTTPSTWARIIRHQTTEFRQINFPVPVQVRLGNHVPHLGLSQGLPEIVHGQPQLLLRDEAVTVSVENFEGMNYIILERLLASFNH